MKKAKLYVFTLLVAMAIMCLSACGSNKDTGTSQSSAESTSAQTTTQTSGEQKSTAADMMDEEESTGVIDGMINDVESGVDDMTGGETNTTSGDTQTSQGQ